MKKKFAIPEAIIIELDDIETITVSGPDDEYGDSGTEWWGTNP